MLREAIEDAITRGERLRKDIVGDILKSAAFNDLVNNKRFVDTVAKVIHTRDEITRTLKKNVQEMLRVMKIPSKEEIGVYERRVSKLEREIDRIGRRVIVNRLDAGIAKRKSARKAAPRKAAKRKATRSTTTKKTKKRTTRRR